MKKLTAIGLFVLVILVGYLSLNRGSQKTPSGIAWKTNRPLQTVSSQPLAVGPAAHSKVASVALPRGPMSQPDWFLPITATTSIAYQLHDVRMQWTVKGQSLAITNGPPNPSTQLVTSPSGNSIAWPVGSGFEVRTWPNHTHTWPHTQAVAFSTHRLLTVARKGSSLAITEPGSTTSPIALSGTPAQFHPFTSDGRWLATLSGKHLTWVNTRTGKTLPVATIASSADWPRLVTVRKVGSTSGWLLMSPGTIPGYLLVVSTPGGGVHWYRWHSAISPQLVVGANHLVLDQSESSGPWWVIGSSHRHALSISAGLVSDGPQGIIWRASQGFLRLKRVWY